MSGPLGIRQMKTQNNKVHLLQNKGQGETPN
jgi:hypothetical protein